MIFSTTIKRTGMSADANPTFYSLRQTLQEKQFEYRENNVIRRNVPTDKPNNRFSCV
jgi:hypothetical protein